MKTLLIAYDIFDQKRLRKVRKIAYSYAPKGQKSALEASLGKKETLSLTKELLDATKDNDQINIIKIIGKAIYLGKQPLFERSYDSMIFL